MQVHDRTDNCTWMDGLGSYILQHLVYFIERVGVTTIGAKRLVGRGEERDCRRRRARQAKRSSDPIGRQLHSFVALVVVVILDDSQYSDWHERERRDDDGWMDGWSSQSKLRRRQRVIGHFREHDSRVRAVGYYLDKYPGDLDHSKMLSIQVGYA